MNNMSYAYQLLVLDYGGVYSFEYNPAAQDTIMQRSFGKVPKAKEYAAIHPLSSQLAANKINSNQYVERVAKMLNLPSPDYTVSEEVTISVTYDPSPAMVVFVREMRSIGIDCLWADKQEYTSAEYLIGKIRDRLTGLKTKASYVKERPLLT